MQRKGGKAAFLKGTPELWDFYGKPEASVILGNMLESTVAATFQILQVRIYDITLIDSRLLVS